MDSEAGISEASMDSKLKNQITKNEMESDAKNCDIFKDECEGREVDVIQEEKDKDVAIKKKVSSSSTKSSSRSKNEITKECKDDNVERKDSCRQSIDLQKASTSNASEFSQILSKERFSKSKKLSIEELQKPFESMKSPSKRRRSSIPDFSQEESVGTNPALFIWHKGAFKNSLDQKEEVYLTSDSIESEIEDNENEPLHNLVVSESTIMFSHPETSNTASDENLNILEEHHQNKERFHLSDPDDEDFVDDAFDDTESPEPPFDIIIEEVDIKSGATIDTPRSSDSGSDLMLSPDATETKEISFENDLKEETHKQSNSELLNCFLDQPLKVIMEEPKNENPIFSKNLQTTSPEIIVKSENIGDKECVESVKEESFEKPPRPPSRTKKISLNSEVQVSTLTAEAVSSNEMPQNETFINQPSTSKDFGPLIVVESDRLGEETNPRSSSPILTAPPIPPPPKLTSKKLLKQNMPMSEKAPSDESCLPRILQMLTIWPQQFRPLPGLLISDASRVSIQIKFDEEDILQTVAVGGSPS